MKRSLDAAYTVVRDALIQARKYAGLSQAEVAARLGRPQQFVSKYETGERRLDVVELVVLADILHLDADAVLARVRRVIRHR